MPPVFPDFKMQVGAGCQACRANGSKLLARFDLLPTLDKQFRTMAVDGFEVIAVTHSYKETELRIPLRLDNNSVEYRADRRAAFGANILAFVKAAALEDGMDAHAVTRCQPQRSRS